MHQVFESGDIEAISNKLFSMHKSLAMLANVVDYEDKKLQLEGLKNRLEAMASPRLVQAFTAANLGNKAFGSDCARVIPSNGTRF